MLQLPEEMGLMSVAARQTQGRGFGGKAGLSPLGCAMFSVQVSVSSRLGQRIPFLQHLAALAAVEVVRTLPGYQEIDRRVKWPNDIYYSNLMKLGRVLVTSTVMGPTFHLLVGCGFNRSNSNPTICINNLVMQHNRECGTSMELLSSAQLIGRTLTSLKQLISAFQERGQRPSCPSTTRDGCTAGLRCVCGARTAPKPTWWASTTKASCRCSLRSRVWSPCNLMATPSTC
ncbi:biotin--protein ligase-like [Oncorhynchus mykiss]|uniref:biotin--protein ligase-like n=1 Tax=Oncorhynchus mykiss TaxID=8022 RepID=UPI0016344CCD|nr:biotin--protein ligase-like [Oncorhynchus mykiss]